jgi:hypothetical protein
MSERDYDRRRDESPIGGEPDQQQSGDLRERVMRRRILQRKLARSTAEAEKASGGSAAKAAGQKLPDGVRAKMEGALGADFSNVTVHEGPEAGELGAHAFAQGNEVHFAPGQYDPESPKGQKVLGHELQHVVQQRHGRVADPQGFGGGGVAVNDDPGLEAEADVMGDKAAAGGHAHAHDSDHGHGGKDGGAEHGGDKHADAGGAKNDAGAHHADSDKPPAQAKLMDVKKFQDATYNRMGTRSGTGMAELDKALDAYGKMNFEGPTASKQKISALQSLYQQCEAWEKNPKYKDVAQQRKAGVAYLKNEITKEIADERARGKGEDRPDRAMAGSGYAPEKSTSQQIMSALGGVKDGAGAGLKAAPGAIVEHANTERMALSTAAGEMDKQHAGTPPSMEQMALHKALPGKLDGAMKQSNALPTYDAAAGIGLVGVAKAFHDYDAATAKPAETTAGKQQQENARAEAGGKAVQAVAGEFGTIQKGLGNTAAGAGIGLAGDLMVQGVNTVQQAGVAKDTWGAHGKAKEKSDKAADKVKENAIGAEKLELYLKLHKVHLDGGLVKPEGQNPEIDLGELGKMTLMQAKEKYQELRHSEELKLYLKAKSVEEIGAYARKCVTTKVVISAVETIGTAVDLAGSVSGQAHVALAGKIIKYSAKGARQIVSGIKKRDQIMELARLKTLVDGRERGASWVAKMMFMPGIDDKLKQMRARLQGDFKSFREEAKWKLASEQAKQKGGYDGEEIAALQVAREDRYFKALFDAVTTKDAGADRGLAAELLEALGVPVVSQEEWDSYDGPKREEAEKAMKDIYTKALTA